MTIVAEPDRQHTQKVMPFWSCTCPQLAPPLIEVLEHDDIVHPSLGSNAASYLGV